MTRLRLVDDAAQRENVLSSPVAGGASQRIRRRPFARNLGTLVLTRDISIVLNFGGTPSNARPPLSLSFVGDCRQRGFAHAIHGDWFRRRLTLRGVCTRGGSATRRELPCRTGACYLNICSRVERQNVPARNLTCLES